MSEEKDSDYSFCQYTKSFCSISTISCLKYLGEKSVSKWEKLLWTLTLCTCFAIIGYLTHKLMGKYERRHYITTYDYSIVPLFDLSWPAITFCPYSQINMSKYDMCELANNLKDMKEEAKLDFEILETLNIGVITFKRHFMFPEKVFQIYKEAKLDIFNGTHCNWHGLPFDCSQLFSPILTRFGYCYTFNTLRSKDLYRNDVILPQTSEQDVIKAGDQELDMVQFFYNKTAGNYTYPRRILSAGIASSLIISASIPKQKLCSKDNSFIQPNLYVYIHHPTEIPKTSLDYVVVSKKKLTIIKYEVQYLTTQKALKQYSPEIRECYYANEKYLRYFNHYSEDKCRQECLTNLTFSECGCVLFYMPLLRNYKICGLGKKICYDQAFSKFHTDRSIAIKKCKCLPDCVSVKYLTQISNADLTEDVGNVEGMEDVSKVLIYCSNTEVRRIIRIRTYSFVRLVANFGGVISALCNLSLICPIELIYYFSLRLYYNKKLYQNIWYIPKYT